MVSDRLPLAGEERTQVLLHLSLDSHGRYLRFALVDDGAIYESTLILVHYWNRAISCAGEWRFASATLSGMLLVF